VITSRFGNHGTTLYVIEYTAQAIVYLTPGCLEKRKLFVEGEAAIFTQQAMELLYRRVQEGTNEITESMGVGWTYVFSRTVHELAKLTCVWVIYDGVRIKEEEDGGGMSV